MFIMRNILFLFSIAFISYIYVTYISTLIILLISPDFHIGILVFIIIIVQLDNLILFNDLNNIKNNKIYNNDYYYKIIMIK